MVPIQYRAFHSHGVGIARSYGVWSDYFLFVDGFATQNEEVMDVRIISLQRASYGIP